MNDTIAPADKAVEQKLTQGKRLAHPIAEIIGKEFTWLTVVEGLGKPAKDRPYQYLCRCRCGKEVRATWQAISKGDTKSCGCRRQQNTGDRFRKHGMCDSKLYRVFAQMRQRCNNPKNNHYADYGGRGIKVCAGCSTFDGFYKVVGDRPDGMTIERMNVNGNYCCGECSECEANGWGRNLKWASRKEQQNNRRANVFLISAQGERRTMMQWSELTGISFTTLLYRKRRGWSDEDTITRPVNRGKRYDRDFSPVVS
jgi:hypothetical protein